MKMREFLAICTLPVFLGLGACAGGTDESRSREESTPAAEPERLEWAIALHGGAGVIDRDLEADLKEGYLKALEEALELGEELLEAGEPSLDVVEKVVRQLEDAPYFNAGKGAVMTRDGGHELDASIMDGRTLACGAVTGVRTVKNPITLARGVMERTPHVFLAGEGAEHLADEMGLERVEQEYYFTERRHGQWLKKMEALGEDVGEHGTVGVVALDREGNLAAATSTGGLTAKYPGRIGDTPIVGAGTYANNATCAVSGTGKGEEFIRHAVAQSISAQMEYGGLSLEESAEAVVHGELQAGDGGVIAVDRLGNIALVFNSEGMFRAAADSSGRFEVAIWDDEPAGD